ncbi:MAG: TetR/AcrR family transcriptional regulator [Desulfobacteraceae bacterium]|nr:TetR/AcrR family transcriptional regulator [Desulfobacteraceae bacterium]
MKNQPVKRSEKSRDIRNTILDVTRELFLSQGYKKTTIRQIIEKAGIKTGSLYHFFKDKEDIFLNIVREAYFDFIEYSDTITSEKENSVLKYAVTRALELKAVYRYKRIAELYLEAYSSWRITEMVLPINIERNRLFFEKYNKEFNEDDYTNITLALRGIRLIHFSERINSKKTDFEPKCRFLISTALKMFNVPEKEIIETIEKTIEIIKKDNISVYGMSF